MVPDTAEVLFLCVWSIIGSILGFFAFTYTPDKSLAAKVAKCLLTIGIGLFVAVLVSSYLQTLDKFPTHLNILFGGLGSFGIPDFIVRWYPTMSKILATRVFPKVAQAEPPKEDVE